MGLSRGEGRRAGVAVFRIRCLALSARVSAQRAARVPRSVRVKHGSSGVNAARVRGGPCGRGRRRGRARAPRPPRRPPPHPRRHGALPQGPLRHGHGDPPREGRPEVLRQRKTLLLPAPLHLSLRRRVASPPRTNAQGRGLRSSGPTLRLHRHRELRPRHAAAGPQQRQTVLRRQNFVHIRLRQAEALHAVGEDVLRVGTRHRRVQQQAHQSYFEAVQEEAVAEERRPVHRQRDEGGPLQQAALADGVHALFARRERELSRVFDAVGRVHDTPVGRQRVRVRGVPGQGGVRALRVHRQAGLLGHRNGAPEAHHTKGIGCHPGVHNLRVSFDRFVFVVTAIGSVRSVRLLANLKMFRFGVV